MSFNISKAHDFFHGIFVVNGKLKVRQFSMILHTARLQCVDECPRCTLADFQDATIYNKELQGRRQNFLTNPRRWRWLCSFRIWEVPFTLCQITHLYPRIVKIYFFFEWIYGSQVTELWRSRLNYKFVQVSKYKVASIFLHILSNCLTNLKVNQKKNSLNCLRCLCLEL